MSSSKTTTDLNEIREWVESRGGKPSRVVGTENDDSAGVLRIDFPGFSGEGRLEEIPWEEWYQTFEDRGLAFLYQEQTSGGEESRFFRLLKREE